jgi:hypothetical protein
MLILGEIDHLQWELRRIVSFTAGSDKENRINGYLILSGTGVMLAIAIICFSMKLRLVDDPDNLRRSLIIFGSWATIVVLVAVVGVVGALARMGLLRGRAPIGWLPGVVLAFLVLMFDIHRKVGE